MSARAHAADSHDEAAFLLVVPENKEWVCKARRPADFSRFTNGGILVRVLVSRLGGLVDVWRGDFLVTAVRIAVGSVRG